MNNVMNKSLDKLNFGYSAYNNNTKRWVNKPAGSSVLSPAASRKQLSFNKRTIYGTKIRIEISFLSICSLSAVLLSIFCFLFSTMKSTCINQYCMSIYSDVSAHGHAVYML